MSDKSVVEKLMLKPGGRLLVLNAPPGYLEQMGALPAGATLVPIPGPADVIQGFVTSRAQLEARLTELKAALAPKGILWIAYPKLTLPLKGDVNRDGVAACAQTVGLQAVAVFSIDDDWSALRLKVV